MGPTLRPTCTGLENSLYLVPVFSQPVWPVDKTNDINWPPLLRLMNGVAVPRPAADEFSSAPQVFEKAKVPLPPFQLVDLDQLSEKASGYFHSILTCPCGSPPLFEGFFFLSWLLFPFSLPQQGFPKRGSGERGLLTCVCSLPLATGRPLHLPGWKLWDIPAPVTVGFKCCLSLLAYWNISNWSSDTNASHILSTLGREREGHCHPENGLCVHCHGIWKLLFFFFFPPN